MSDQTQHAQTLEEEVVQNDPVTDQEPAPDAPYGHLAQITSGVNPWRVERDQAAQDTRKHHGYVQPAVPTPAGLIGHYRDWAVVGGTGSMRLQGERPRSFAFLNFSSLGVYGFFLTQPRQPQSAHWAVPPYSALVLGTTGPIAWLFDPNGTQAAAPSQVKIAESYIVQAYDILLAPSLTSLSAPTD